MKKLSLCTLILLGLFVSNCSKTKLVPLTNFSGVANYTSPLSPGADPVVLANQKITVLDNGTGITYNLLTDTQGLFSLPGIQPATTLNITLKQTLTDASEFQAVYSAAPVIKGDDPNLGNDMLTAVVDTKNYNGLLITVVDKSGGAVPGAKVIAYTSGEIANLDTDFNAYGSFFTLTSNTTGLCLAMQLPQTLYIKAIFTSSDGKIKLQSSPQMFVVDSYKPINITLQ